MTPIVALIAPGNMGSGVAQRLTENKVKVLTSLAGRSEASAKRARAAGMIAVEDAQLTEADFLMSIVPPGDALGLAKRLAPVLTAANKKPVYVECNAVSPRTMLEIAGVIGATGCPFVGAGIIGPPPKPGTTNTKIYASGPAAASVRQAQRLRADRARARRPAHRRLGAENVLCRHHQGLHGLGRRHDAGRHPRRLGRSAEGRTRRQPARAARLSEQAGAEPCIPKPIAGWPRLEEISEFVGKDHPENDMMRPPPGSMSASPRISRARRTKSARWTSS